MIGTAIEFFDFYIYAVAAVLVFPKLFFPKSDPTTATLESLATFALAFFARPVGSMLFGHFGDRIGRKATLVTALLTMGISTVAIGLLPTYGSIGVPAALLLALCRVGQGLGLGGEWGGAVLLATENAPPGRQAWYGCFPQLGAPVGFLCSTGTFLLLGKTLTPDQFMLWGWRVPFLASALLVATGLYVRLKLTETPAFREVIENGERVRIPMIVVFVRHWRAVLTGMIGSVATFVIFYLINVFSLSWATSKLGYPRQDFLVLQMFAVLFFAAMIPVSALVADRIGGRMMLIIASLLLCGFGFLFEPLFGSGGQAGVLAYLVIGFTLTGITYGPLGSALSSLFPTAIRYTGTSLAFNFAGILGGSFAPAIATWLATHYGLRSVGLYLSAASALSLLALLFVRVHDDGRALARLRQAPGA
ncbi:MAG: MFS transporter [Steroidobacterales bacterium]